MLISRQLIKYGMVGAINTAVAAFTMLLLSKTGWHYAVYTALGYGAGMLTSFCLNFRFTFDARGNAAQRFLRFIIVNLSNLLIAEVIQWLLIEKAGWPHHLSIFIGMCWYVACGFLLNRYWVFA